MRINEAIIKLRYPFKECVYVMNRTHISKHIRESLMNEGYLRSQTQICILNEKREEVEGLLN